jgi:hypothetical protein
LHCFSELNTRSTTNIGIVGAGGMGLYLSDMIRVPEWRETAFLILMVLVTVAAIDANSRRLRVAIPHARYGYIRWTSCAGGSSANLCCPRRASFPVAGWVATSAERV